MELPYTWTYSKDPFLDALNIYTWMSAQARVAWVQYVEKALALEWCSLSKEKQWSILYSFVPEFRWEIARGLKIDHGDYDSKNYVFNEDVLLDYCTEFYNCVNNKPDWWNEWNKVITSGTPEHIKTNCKEFFQVNYREWEAEQKKIQNLQISWLWNDRYVNATVKESPYDLMTDLGAVWELSYLQAQKPIVPVFYNLPIFAEYENELMNGKYWGNDCVEETYGGVVSLGGESLSPDGSVSLWGLTPLKTPVITPEGGRVEADLWRFLWDWNGESNIEPKSTRLPTSEFDRLVEWLWVYTLKQNDSTYYWSLCRDEEIEPEQEIEQNIEPIQEGIVPERSTIIEEQSDLPELTKEEYQELVEYMQESVSSYASLSESKKEEIEKKAKNLTKGATDVDEIEGVAQDILSCYKSCVWLSVDGQFACMLECSCWEIESPIFNPDVNPGMWPIFIVRFCAVPSVNPRYFYEWSSWTEDWDSTLVSWWSKWKSWWSKWRSWWWSNWWGTIWWGTNWWWSNWGGTIWWWSWWWSNWWSCSTDWDWTSREVIWSSFNKWWTTMVSMEKWINEIYWVVDKLSREWRLWIWTQQYNFLDSTTKMTDIADSFSFTMGMDKKNIAQKAWEPTEQYQRRYMKARNNDWMVAYHVSNPLDNPSTKNRYRLVSYDWEIAGDISSSANADATRQAQWYLNMAPSFVVDQSENTNATRYAMVSVLFAEWMDEQWDYWDNKVEYLKELDQYAKALYAKKW